MDFDQFSIKEMKPGRVLDGHVHDVLCVPEPVWPYSTHENARPRLREWLKTRNVQIFLPGQARACDDCVILWGEFRESFEAVNESHALCLAVLMADYLKKHGYHFRVGNFR